MSPTRTAHESAHGHLKSAVHDALLLRGAVEFADLADSHSTMSNNMGIVSSATAYQRKLTRHRIKLDLNRRSPAWPSSTAVMANPPMLGPSNIATKMRAVSAARR